MQAEQSVVSNAAAERTLQSSKKICRQFGQRFSSAVAVQGTKRQRAYYDLNFGTEVPKQIVNTDACYKQARLNLLTITRPDDESPLNCMFTYVPNYAHAEILAHRQRGPFAVPRAEEHGTYLLESKMLQRKTDHTCPATVVMSYQRRRHDFQQRVMKTGIYDSLGGHFGGRMRRTE